MEFRTPWSGAREREAVARRPRPVPRLAPAPGARTVLGDRGAGSGRPSSCPTAQQVRLIGYADRLELDDDGRVVVVDLKTGEVPARPTPSCRATPSSASTSSPSTTAPPTRPPGRPARVRAAPSWSSSATASGLPKVQPQAPQAPDADGVTADRGAADAGRARPSATRTFAARRRRPLRALRLPRRSARPRPPGSVLS